MARKVTSFRVGKVSVYLRGKVWYLCYYENGCRKRPRAGTDRMEARRLAAQTNAQLEVSAPAPLSFEQVSNTELRQRWLAYHESVLRSSVATVQRYRTASVHLLNFIRDTNRTERAAVFSALDAEDFVVYLRRIRIAPNGHPNTIKRPLRDKGVKYVLEVCRSMFNYAAKNRYLPPYSENPLGSIRIDRLPVEDAKPFTDLSMDQERCLFEACDDWQFPILLTLILTGLRPGELRHLLLPDDLDAERGLLKVCNKADLGWKTKTRNERTIPLVPELAEVLHGVAGNRTSGPLFLRRRFVTSEIPLLANLTRDEIASKFKHRTDAWQSTTGREPSREQRHRIARTLWTDLGAVRTDRIRTEFMALTKRIGLPDLTAPKALRHLFATALQDGNVDPLIRNELMGHAPAGGGSPNGGLGMTGMYTHNRPATVRRQLEGALRNRPATLVAKERVACCSKG